jgi:hypothetical protein
VRGDSPVLLFAEPFHYASRAGQLSHPRSKNGQARSFTGAVSSFETRLRLSSGRGRSRTHEPRPEAPRSGLEGTNPESAIPQRALSAPFCKRNERGIIAANVSFLLCSRPSFDSTLGGDRIDYSRIVFGMHKRHRASAKRVATLVEPKGMFTDPLVDRSPRDSRLVAAVCAAQNVDRRAVQEPVPPGLSHTL